jgi:hypothetical protein
MLTVSLLLRTAKDQGRLIVEAARILCIGRADIQALAQGLPWA